MGCMVSLGEEDGREVLCGQPNWNDTVLCAWHMTQWTDEMYLEEGPLPYVEVPCGCP